uniref:Myb-like domain-containing protein n=1 Tax=Oryza nivara TaxID=4536 RepID=A0A0E0FL25_ORYNI
MVVVGDEAVQRAVVLRLGVNFRATVCSEINAAVEMLRERTKEFDFAVISEESIRSLRPEIMKFLGEETGLRLLVSCPSSGDQTRNCSTAAAAAAAAVASSVRRATNGRKHRRRAGEKSSQHRQRKKRFIWTPELSKIFIEIYEELLLTGINPVPTKILELMKLRIGPMNDPELTRNTVSSYLQKYKAYLLKQEQKDQQLPIDDNTNTSSIKSQQGSASLQQQIMNYGENDSMDNQSIILSQTRYNEHSNKQPKLLTANYHGPRNMHHHHKNTNMQPSNVLRPPNLINAKGFNMSFNKEEINEAIYQSQLTTRRVSATHAIAKAQASWRVTMTKDMHPISQLHQQDDETTPDDSSNNTNSIYEKYGEGVSSNNTFGLVLAIELRTTTTDIEL